MKVHLGWQVLEFATSAKVLGVWHILTQSLVGVTPESPNNPFPSGWSGHISIQTLVGSYANVGMGHDEIQSFVVFYP